MKKDMNRQGYKIDFSNLPLSSPAPGVRSKVYGDGNRQIRWVEFSRDFIELDWSRKGHIGYVLEGELEINFGGRLIIFKPGDGIFITAGEESQHKARAITDVVQLLLVEDL